MPQRAHMRSLTLTMVIAFGLAAGCGGDDATSAAPDGGSQGGGDGGARDGSSTGGNDGDSAGPAEDSGVIEGPDGSVFGCGGASADPAGAAAIDGYMKKLPNPPPAGTTRTEAIDAILKACVAFGPPPGASGWKQEYCWAHLVAAISKESGYVPTGAAKDAYATRTVNGQTANDPTVGMLQIRFSSEVHDIVQLGSLTHLACAGCPLPASITSHANDNDTYWAVTGPSANMSTMTNVACNVGIGAWYYYLAATSNGRASKVTYSDEYCAGGGTAANLVTGLMSHLLGPDGGKGVQVASDAQLTALKSSNGGAYGYVSEIKGNWDKMIGPVSGTHPFYLLLAPNPTEYCK